MQTWPTLAGLIGGTAAMIIVVALGLSGRAFGMSQNEAGGSHVVWATYEGNVTSGVAHAVDDSINESDLHAMAARTDLFAAVTPLVQTNGSVTVEARTVNIAVLGTTPNYIDVRKNVHILRGRFIDQDDLAQRAKVAVVSRDLYEKLFHNDDSPEKSLRVLGMTLTVIGEFENPIDTIVNGGTRPHAILVPTTVPWCLRPTPRPEPPFARV